MDWNDWRYEFPITERLVHLNHAGVAPASRRVVAAVTSFITEATTVDAPTQHRWSARCEQVRAGFARLVGAQADEIAFVKNTSEGLSLVAAGLEWRAGDNVIAVDGEYPVQRVSVVWPASVGRGDASRPSGARARARRRRPRPRRCAHSPGLRQLRRLEQRRTHRPRAHRRVLPFAWHHLLRRWHPRRRRRSTGRRALRRRLPRRRRAQVVAGAWRDVDACSSRAALPTASGRSCMAGRASPMPTPTCRITSTRGPTLPSSSPAARRS